MPTRGYTDPGTRRVSHYDPTLSLLYSSDLWKTCPLLEYAHDRSIGVLLDEQWNSYNAAATTGDYLLTQAGAAGSAAKSTTVIGTLSIDSGSTTVTQGANVQRLKAGFLPAAGKHIWGEFVVSYTGVGALNVETLVGLAESDTTIIGSSAVSTANHLGWSSVTDDGVLLFNVSKTGPTGTTAAATTIVSGTQIKLGFFYDGTADTVQQYINGVATGDAIATTYIPKAMVYPSFVCQTGGTDQPVLHSHGYRIFQLR